MEPFGFGALHETLKVPPEINTKEFFRVLDFTTFFVESVKKLFVEFPQNYLRL